VSAPVASDAGPSASTPPSNAIFVSDWGGSASAVALAIQAPIEQIFLSGQSLLRIHPSASQAPLKLHANAESKIKLNHSRPVGEITARKKDISS